MESKDHKQNWLLVILAIGLVATSIILATSQSKGAGTSGVTPGGMQQNTLSVAGQGIITTKPDQAELYIQIETKGSTAYEAQTRNTENANRVMSMLKEKGIAEDNMETTQYYLDEEREWENNKMVRKGYVLRHTLKVTTNDLEKAGELLDAAIRAGANGVERISFTLSQEKQKEINGKALEKAATSAKEKAEAITDALGINLGKISSVSESNVQYTPYDYYPTMARMALVAEDAEPTTIQPSDITVNAYINLVFEIRQ